jgi:hypothetical protein
VGSATAQWCSSTFQLNLDAGIGPVSGSMASPEKEITWPARNVVVADGVRILTREEHCQP